MNAYQAHAIWITLVASNDMYGPGARADSEDLSRPVTLADFAKCRQHRRQDIVTAVSTRERHGGGALVKSGRGMRTPEGGTCTPSWLYECKRAAERR